MQNTVGLFGTCDGSTWREDEFIDRYDNLGIKWFNPQVEDWDPSLVAIENEHLRTDNIILFPVLAESLGIGSLGEIGFSINTVITQIIAEGKDQTLIVLIDDKCTDERKTESERTISDRTRKLVKSKVANVNHPNVYLVETLEDMYNLSLVIYNIYNMKESADALRLVTED